MADYEKMTVANLRALLKDRGIPSTGLTRKAQIIEKLIEEDTQRSATAEAAEPDPAVDSETVEASRTIEKQDAPEGSTLTEIPTQSQPEVESPATTVTLQADEQNTQTETQTAPSATSPVPSKEPDVIADPPALIVPQESSTTQIDPVELAEDQSKRRKRSATPPVKAAEVEAKRLKLNNGESLSQINVDNQASQAAGEPHASVPTKDAETIDDAPKSPSSVNKSKTVVEQLDQKASVMLDETFGEAEQQSVREEKQPISGEKNEHTEEAVASRDAGVTSPTKKRHTETRDHRFQGLLKRDSTTQQDPVVTEEEKDLPTVSPALHHATAALYIRNFQRPLREDQLKERLSQLAASKDGDEAELELCYLDPVRTHALALFTSVTAASRVRSTMHERVWPQERDRKPLWVDFVPEERVREWIKVEQDGGTGPRAGGKRWEVVYEKASSGEIEAHLQEVGATRRPTAPDTNIRGVARSPSPRSQRAIPERQAPTQPAVAVKNFQTLDSLFKSTSTTKPKLYYLPVAPDLAERRLREISGLTKRDWDERDRRPNDELRRYTFEDDDVLVDGGGHFMSKKQMAKEGITSTGTSNPTGRPGPMRRGRGRGPPPGDRYRGSGYADADDPYPGDRRGGQTYRPR